MNDRRNGGMAWLYFAKLAALAANLVLYNMVGNKLGVEGFSEYSLARRSIALLIPILLAGQLVALPRYIAMNINSNEHRHSAFLASLLIVLLVSSFLLGIVIAAPGLLATWFFGDRAHTQLLIPMALLMISQGLFGLLSAYFQGYMNFRAFAIIGIVLGGVAPVVGFWIAPHSTSGAMVSMAAVIGGLACCLTFAIFVRNNWPKLTFVQLREMIDFGLPRVPGDFAMGGMLSLPSILVANRIGLVEGGYVAFCGTMISMVVTVVSPISTAWLPQYTLLAARGEGHLMRKNVTRTVGLVAVGLVLCLLVIVPTMGKLTSWYLGSAFLPAVTIFRVYCLGLVPIAIYGCLRSIVDAAYIKPVNTYNIIVSLVVFYGLEIVLRSHLLEIWALIWAALISYFVLAILTIASSWKPLQAGFHIKSRYGQS